MSKVSPSDFDCDASLSGSRIGILVTMAAKVFSIVSRRFDLSESLPSTSHSTENGDRAPEVSSLDIIGLDSTKLLRNLECTVEVKMQKKLSPKRR
ncbi:unnamed protein product [Nippostrongylus brasiliensis]|uniref:Uncharacterized protein n=1 Tax=Nippostrongylus brasiliensis TaxID=27835 RepID=A0A0N4XCY5_NIPBR|nr:unnamed protein product [Nippostrongylus brasiliensis]